MKIFVLLVLGLSASALMLSSVSTHPEAATVVELVTLDAPLPVCEEAQSNFNSALNAYQTSGCNGSSGNCGTYLAIMGSESQFACQVFTDPDSDNGPSCGWVCSVSTCGGGCE